MEEFDENEQLRCDARKGLEQRLKQVRPVASRKEYFKRLEYELKVIIDMGFAGYFLIVADFINWSKNNGVPVGPGYGSGTGSMVAWSIRITDLDPFRFGLLFERFLNPERVNMPDFDVDFCKEGRERTIADIRERYGADRVAQAYDDNLGALILEIKDQSLKLPFKCRFWYESNILTLLRDTVRLIGKDHDFLPAVPLDDADTYEMLSKGDTSGVFRFESEGMKDVLHEMRPDCFDDLMAAFSLYRPGPMDNIPSYIARKHGKEKVEYPYPTLEAVLKETYGIIIYQEQLMRIAQATAGYSPGEADMLRRVMGKMHKAEIARQKPIFTDGALKKGPQEEDAGKLFALMEKSAPYAFCKAHAAACTLVAYQAAYLKRHYRSEFMSAVNTILN